MSRKSNILGSPEDAPAPEPPEKDAELEFVRAVSEKEIKRFYAEVAQYMGWQHGVDLNHISANLFRVLRDIAFLERFAPDEPVEERARRARVTTQERERLMETPEYQEVAACLAEAVGRAALPRKLKEHMHDPLLQHRAAQRTIELAFQDQNMQVSERALQQLNDRMMAPERGRDGARMLVIDASAFEAMRETMGMIEAKEEKLVGPGITDTDDED